MSLKLRFFHGPAAIWFCTSTLALAIGCGGDTSTDTATAKDTRSARAAITEYPEDLPVYPGAKFLEGRRGKSENGVSVSLESTDPVQKVAATFLSMLEKDGWFVQSTIRDEAYIIFADKGSRNFSAALRLNPSGP